MEQLQVAEKNVEPDGIDVEEALKRSGPFGKFQVIVQIFFMYAILASTYHSMTSYFEGDNPPWTCTHGNTSDFCNENMGKVFSMMDTNFSKRCDMERSEWRYTTEKSYSYVTEFDMICSENTLAATIGGILFIGGAVASIISGPLADIYGRKKVLTVALIGLFLCSTITSFVTQIWQLILLRMFIGAGQGIGFSLSFIYLAEFITTSHRSLSGNICNMGFTLSMFFLVVMAYAVQKWRMLQLYLSLPALLAVVGCYFLPESPRWLLATGKAAEAEEVLRKIAKINGKEKHEFKLKLPLKEVCDKKYTYLDLFKKREALKTVLALGVVWMAGGLLYFAVTLQSSNLGGNMYANFAYVSLPDFPCCILTIYLCNNLGRKKTTLGAFFLSGLTLGGIAIVFHFFHSNYLVSIILSILGKSFLNISYDASYIWTFELFPTVLRNQGFSICLILSSIGSSGAPYLSNVLEVINPALPYEIMGVIGVATAVIGCLLPETNNCPTRELYDDFDKKSDDDKTNNFAVVNAYEKPVTEC